MTLRKRPINHPSMKQKGSDQTKERSNSMGFIRPQIGRSMLDKSQSCAKIGSHDQKFSFDHDVSDENALLFHPAV